jgi:hypothetical protein
LTVHMLFLCYDWYTDFFPEQWLIHFDWFQFKIVCVPTSSSKHMLICRELSLNAVLMEVSLLSQSITLFFQPFQNQFRHILHTLKMPLSSHRTCSY